MFCKRIFRKLIKLSNLFFKKILKLPVSLLIFLVILLVLLTPVLLHYVEINIEPYGKPYIQGSLVNIMLLAIIFESITKRIPRFLIILPIIFYGGYYSYYYINNLGRLESEIFNFNKGVKIEYKNNTNTIIFDTNTRYPESLIKQYNIPVVYNKKQTSENNNKYFLHSIIKPELCRKLIALKNEKKQIHSKGLFIKNYMSNSWQSRSYCHIRILDKLPNNDSKQIIISETENNYDNFISSINKSVFKIRTPDGEEKILMTLSDDYNTRKIIPKIPMALLRIWYNNPYCTFGSSIGWKFNFGFYKENGYYTYNDNTSLKSVLSRALKLKTRVNYTPQETSIDALYVEKKLKEIMRNVEISEEEKKTTRQKQDPIY